MVAVAIRFFPLVEVVGSRRQVRRPYVVAAVAAWFFPFAGVIERCIDGARFGVRIVVAAVAVSKVP